MGARFEIKVGVMKSNVLVDKREMNLVNMIVQECVQIFVV
jgi:hypothetical protein